MTIVTHLLVYPDGDTQEVPHRLSINMVVDLNGNPLPLPLATPKIIAYRVYRISTQESRGEEVTSYFLELLNRDMIMEYVAR
jgi:hypothetical protein